MRHVSLSLAGLALAGLVALTGQAVSHGDVVPQPVDTTGLPTLGDDWLTENPYRDPAGEAWAAAIKIGGSGYNQNCARCHGLEVISGGLAPDLRFLEAEAYGDEWFVERVRNGAVLNGITRMPAFDGLMSQEAVWAMRTYVEARPDDQAVGEMTPRLREVRDGLDETAKAIAAGTPAADFAAEIETVRAELQEIADAIPTMSGAPVSDSIARRAALILETGGDTAAKEAAETLTIGLSAAR